MKLSYASNTFSDTNDRRFKKKKKKNADNVLTQCVLLNDCHFKGVIFKHFYDVPTHLEVCHTWVKTTQKRLLIVQMYWENYSR